GNPAAEQSKMVATPSLIVANGISESVITLTLQDSNNNPILGQSVVFSTSLENSDIGDVTDNRDGTYTARLIGTKTGTATITTSLNGNPFGVAPAMATLIADMATAQITANNLTVKSSGNEADGVATNSVKVTVTDANNNLVPNAVVNFTATNGATITPAGTTGVDGTVVATLTSFTVGDSTITASINGSSRTVNVAFVTANMKGNAVTYGKIYDLKSGFPQSGFSGATFNIEMAGGNSNYNWSVDQSWVKLNIENSGNTVLVVFDGKATTSTKTVTIMAESKTKPGPTFVYKFTVDAWYSNIGNAKYNYSQANDICLNQGEFLPNKDSLMSDTFERWGTMSNYGLGGFQVANGDDDNYWTSTNYGQSHYIVNLDKGETWESKGGDSSSYWVTCRKGL
ncbi:TPA: invasin domain 3-containing protein, partial [Enterobacter roggenkampii]